MWGLVGTGGRYLCFLGNTNIAWTKKGRVAIPPKARGDFSDGIVVTRGYDNCIVAYTTMTWDRLAEEYASLPSTDRGARLVNRLVFSSAFRLTLDRLGRLGLPTPLRKYAQIDEEVVVAGVGSHLEIWGKELWARERELMEEKASEIAQGLSGVPQGKQDASF